MASFRFHIGINGIWGTFEGISEEAASMGAMVLSFALAAGVLLIGLAATDSLGDS